MDNQRGVFFVFLCADLIELWWRQDYPREFGRMMDSYTPMTSANTTPATTPGSTPPSGSDAHSCLATNADGHSLSVVSCFRWVYFRGLGGEANMSVFPLLGLCLAIAFFSLFVSSI